jgi:hypothetical protein
MAQPAKGATDNQDQQDAGNLTDAKFEEMK